MSSEINLKKEALSVLDFCHVYGLSRSMFYKLKKCGKVPVIMKVGKRTLITIESARKWAKKMEQKTM